MVRDGQALRYDNFSKVPLLIVPIKEQEAIAKYIDVQLEKTKISIDLQQQQIEKLKEYKSSLIDAAVTGNIKVS